MNPEQIQRASSSTSTANESACRLINALNNLMLLKLPPSSLRSYDAIQERLDSAIYESPEFMMILSGGLQYFNSHLRELAAEVSRCDSPEITPFLIYCHDQFEIGRKLNLFEMCRCFGRILGEAMCRGKNEPVHAETQERRYGLNISFIVAVCPRCGETNRGIPALAGASMKTISSSSVKQSKANGVGALCAGCFHWFIAEWD